MFAMKFASKDTKEFLSAACTFTVWLGSEKVYYAVARPRVRSHLTARRVIPITQSTRLSRFSRWDITLRLKIDC